MRAICHHAYRPHGIRPNHFLTPGTNEHAMNEPLEASAGAPDITIRTIADPADLRRAIDVFDGVWGSSRPLATIELLRAIGHAGGYVAGAFADGEMVGASFGFLGTHQGEPALHSHVTGIVAQQRSTGIGQAMKRQQRAWAAERGLQWVTWTFDPLVRPNAWFNLEVLGVSVVDYLVDFYGQIDDEINAGDESDRLLVAWPTHRDRTPLATPRIDAEVALVATPSDVVELRSHDPDAAREWRRRLRDELGRLIAGGGRVVGFSRNGEYRVLPAPSGPER
jgi:predicted GNAT superfamily acetyltransferase